MSAKLQWTHLILMRTRDKYFIVFNCGQKLSIMEEVTAVDH